MFWCGRDRDSNHLWFLSRFVPGLDEFKTHRSLSIKVNDP